MTPLLPGSSPQSPLPKATVPGAAAAPSPALPPGRLWPSPGCSGARPAGARRGPAAGLTMVPWIPPTLRLLRARGTPRPELAHERPAAPCGTDGACAEPGAAITAQPQGRLPGPPAGAGAARPAPRALVGMECDGRLAQNYCGLRAPQCKRSYSRRGSGEPRRC